MKKFILMMLTFAVSYSAFSQTTTLDASAVKLAEVLIKPAVRECIDSALLANNVTNNNEGAFSVEQIQTYIAREPLFSCSNSERMQRVEHFILTTRAHSRIGSGPVSIVFDIKISSGTGILSYSCSSAVL